MMEARERPVGTRPDSPLGDPKGGASRTEDGNIGSGDAGLSVASKTLAQMFEARSEDLDLAIMKVIAEGGSPSEWIAGMLRQVSEAAAPPEQPRARFLGE